MYTVTNASVHAQFLRALEKPHRRVSYVDVWYGGVKIDSLNFEKDLESGSVFATGRNRERRTLNLGASERLWPYGETDSLSPYGIWLQAFTTIEAGATAYGPIPVFAGKVTRVKRKRRSGVVMVKAVDPMRQVNQEPIEAPRQAPQVPIPTAILTLLREVLPSASLTNETTLSVTITDNTVWNAGWGSRGRALDELSAALGAELFALPTAVYPNGEFVLRPVPGLDGAADWTVTGNIVEDDQQEKSNEEVVNRWIVSVERPDSTTLFVRVTDDDPSSATRYGGPMGNLAKDFSSALIQTVTQAETAGRAKLNRTKGIASARRLAMIANPALECGDLISVSVDGEPYETNIVDDFELPLTADQADMVALCRASGGDE